VYPALLPPRDEALARARSLGAIDVLIVGAGVNGCGVFRDLALQGVNCLIVDREDFGAGASMASSRMAHGGLRYLENGEFRLTAEATRERNLLLRNAAHMVRPLPIAIPFFSYFAGLFTAARRAFGFKASLKERGFVMAEIGLLLYDWFGRLHRATPLHFTLGRARARARFPSLSAQVKAVSAYYDAVISAPERIALELVGDGLAAAPGSCALNHCRVEAVEGGAVVLRDLIGGERLSIRPRVVFNAGGAWIDRVNQALGGARPLIGGTKGSHLVLRLPTLSAELAGSGMVFDDRQGRVCFLYGMGDNVLVGSTDIPVADPDKVFCTDEEQDYLLGALGVIFPGVRAQRSHVVYRFCGVRPLPRSNAATPGAVTRDHSLVVTEPDAVRPFPVFSLVGGKWTTFRAFAEQASDAALQRLGLTRVRRTTDCPIGGGLGFPSDEGAQAALVSRLAREFDVDLAQARRALKRYGAGAGEVLKYLRAETDETLPGPEPYTAREIRRFVRQEMATTLDDIIFRRTNLAMEGALTRPLIERIGEILAQETGLGARAAEDALEAFIQRIRTVNAVPNIDPATRTTKVST
jgi:glycerol-3-phosphate dehydrogenase